METFWNEQRINRLTYLLTEGWSYSQIAADIGAASRNAISGKVDRLGLTRPTRSPEDVERTRQATVARNLENRRIARGTKTIQLPRERKMLSAPAKPLPEFVGSLNIPTRDLRDFKHDSPNQCRYIADEPPGPDYLACGNETFPGASYCPHCTEILKPKPQLSHTERSAMTSLRIRNYHRSQGRAA